MFSWFQEKAEKIDFYDTEEYRALSLGCQEKSNELDQRIKDLEKALGLETRMKDSLLGFHLSGRNIQNLFLCLQSTLHKQFQSNQNLEKLAFQSRLHQKEQLDFVEDCRGETSVLMQGFDDFLTRLQRIEELSRALEDMTEHIHIVSLNASVEAARADRNGAGFAVLAREFRDLAAQSRGLSGDVRVIADTVMSDARNLSAGIGKVEEALQSLERLAGEIGQGSIELNQQSSLLGKGLEFSLLCSMVGLALLEEMELKRLVYHSLASRTLAVKLEDFPSEKECPLGQWYENPDVVETFGALKGFQSLRIPHARTHYSGKRALEFLLKEDWPQAFLALEQMEESSLRVIEGLTLILGEGAA